MDLSSENDVWVSLYEIGRALQSCHHDNMTEAQEQEWKVGVAALIGISSQIGNIWLRNTELLIRIQQIEATRKIRENVRQTRNYPTGVKSSEESI